jgi:hypothetical protein
MIRRPLDLRCRGPGLPLSALSDRYAYQGDLGGGGGVEKAAWAGRPEPLRRFTSRAEIGPNPPAFLERVLPKRPIDTDFEECIPKLLNDNLESRADQASAIAFCCLP